jgi:glycerophosphoryl diester phosphodiesterase
MKIVHWSILFLAGLFCLNSAAGDNVKKPVFLGHRGDREMGLQNTMSAFKGAWQNGCKGVELDIRTTADGKMICFHDPNFSVMANDKRKVSQLTYEEILKLDIGSRKHPMFKDEKPPLLEEFFAAMPADTIVQLEIKSGAVDDSFPIKLQALLKKYNIDQARVYVISFEESPLRNLNKLTPGMKNMLIVSMPACRALGMNEDNNANSIADNLIAKLKEIGCTGVSFCGSDARIKFDASFIKKVKDAGFEFSMWTINDLYLSRKLAEMQVDYIVSDRPSSLEYMWKKRFE